MPEGAELTKDQLRKHAWYIANRARMKDATKRRRDEPITRLWGRQRPAACEICGGKNNNGRPLCADHDHETGQPRLFLCTRCNTLEGYIKKDFWRLKALIAYHLWCDGLRGVVNIPIEIKNSYPQSPPAAPEDAKWIKRVFERATKRYPKL